VNLVLVVGLGNPGPTYRDTRHNVGFAVVDSLIAAYRSPPTRLQHRAQLSRGRVGEVDALWCKPQTYMNASGESVGVVARYYRLDPQDILVVHDELDFPVGQVRFKQGGGHGGHNGLRSLIAHLGADFTRLRVGIGRPPAGVAAEAHVLSGFAPDEQEPMAAAVQTAGEAVRCLLRQGLRQAMNQFNR
jgi:PTH1 family peptidyl-tRNA hydrolase